MDDADAPDYDAILSDIVDVIEKARAAAARSVNTVMTVAYWLVGRRIVEHEQGGQGRASYGEGLLERLSADLTARVGRGFGVANMYLMRQFYLTWPPEQILQTASGGTARPAILQTASGESGSRTPAKSAALPGLGDPAWQGLFPLPWSAYVRLLSVDGDPASRFYETEALRNGWTVRQLDRQINSMFFERTALSKDKTAMLLHGGKQQASDQTAARAAIRDPFILEFLDLKDEYSETDLEDALIDHLAEFLLELGDNFTFLARQRRMRIDDRWFRCDLVLYHRTLRCLVLIDLKIGRYSYEAAGQMGMYLSYARHNWMKDGENPPVGLILCSSKGADEARYSLESLNSSVLTAQYKLALPATKVLEAELARSRQALEQRSRVNHSADADGRSASEDGLGLSSSDRMAAVSEAVTDSL